MNQRVEQIFIEEFTGDTSFQEKETFLNILLGTKSYSKVDMRETWDSGIKLGIETGLRRASVEGQKLELYSNITNAKDKEFLDKFYKLANDYGCSIQYNSNAGGMIILKTK